jgi:hypothetical protein
LVGIHVGIGQADAPCLPKLGGRKRAEQVRLRVLPGQPSKRKFGKRRVGVQHGHRRWGQRQNMTEDLQRSPVTIRQRVRRLRDAAGIRGRGIGRRRGGQDFVRRHGQNHRAVGDRCVRHCRQRVRQRHRMRRRSRRHIGPNAIKRQQEQREAREKAKREKAEMAGVHAFIISQLLRPVKPVSTREQPNEFRAKCR